MREKGSISLLTLFIASVIITVGISFNWFIREYLRNAEALKKKTEAMLEVYSAFDLLNYLILTGMITNKDIKITKIEALPLEIDILPLDGRPFTLLHPQVIITLQDTNGLISLQSINEEALKKLIQRAGYKNPDALIETYYDWVDTDDLKRLLGAEEDDYEKEGYLWKPRNYPLQSKAELQFIKGWNEKLYKFLSPYITLMPASGFNPNTAPVEVLMAVLDIDEATAWRLKDYIEKVKPLVRKEELFIILGKPVILGEEFDFKPSQFFEVNIEYRKDDNIQYAVKAGLRKLGTPFSPYTLVYWIEE